ncbi:hypothetical protein ACA910_002210 [Epithemia clementina (nom. ined.)]
MSPGSFSDDLFSKRGLLANGGASAGVVIDHGGPGRGGGVGNPQQPPLRVTAAAPAPPPPPPPPKKPLSAYNLFFKLERARILQHSSSSTGRPPSSHVITWHDLCQVSEAHRNRSGKRVHCKVHGKIGFYELSQAVSEAWKQLHAVTRDMIRRHAKMEQHKYALALTRWEQGRKEEESSSSLALLPPMVVQQQQQQQPNHEQQEQLERISGRGAGGADPPPPPASPSRPSTHSFSSSSGGKVSMTTKSSKKRKSKQTKKKKTKANDQPPPSPTTSTSSLCIFSTSLLVKRGSSSWSMDDLGCHPEGVVVAGVALPLSPIFDNYEDKKQPTTLNHQEHQKQQPITRRSSDSQEDHPEVTTATVNVLTRISDLGGPKSRFLAISPVDGEFRSLA